jgi:hypothetical protein
MDARKRWFVYAGMALCTGAALFVTDPSPPLTGSDPFMGKCGY